MSFPTSSPNRLSSKSHRSVPNKFTADDSSQPQIHTRRSHRVHPRSFGLLSPHDILQFRRRLRRGPTHPESHRPCRTIEQTSPSPCLPPSPAHTQRLRRAICGRSPRSLARRARKTHKVRPRLHLLTRHRSLHARPCRSSRSARRRSSGWPRHHRVYALLALQRTQPPTSACR